MGISIDFTEVKWGEKPVDKTGDRYVDEQWVNRVVIHVAGLIICSTHSAVDKCAHVLLTYIRRISTRFPQYNAIKNLGIQFLPYFGNLFADHKVKFNRLFNLIYRVDCRGVVFAAKFLRNPWEAQVEFATE